MKAMLKFDGELFKQISGIFTEMSSALSLAKPVCLLVRITVPAESRGNIFKNEVKLSVSNRVLLYITWH